MYLSSCTVALHILYQPCASIPLALLRALPSRSQLKWKRKSLESPATGPAPFSADTGDTSQPHRTMTVKRPLTPTNSRFRWKRRLSSGETLCPHCQSYSTTCILYCPDYMYIYTYCIWHSLFVFTIVAYMYIVHCLHVHVCSFYYCIIMYIHCT